MLQDSETEKEILLGNKQLLGIFLVVVVLLAVAFGAGYKVGEGSHKPGPIAQASPAQAAPEQNNPPTPGVTQTVPPEENTGAGTPATDTNPVPSASAPLGARRPGTAAAVSRTVDGEAPGPEPAQRARTAEPKPVSGGEFVPQPGETFLQVAAVKREEAEAIAEVLRRRGLPAHAVPKPGQGSPVYRVLVGPTRDAADLSSKRESLRSAGFRHIFIQRY